MSATTYLANNYSNSVRKETEPVWLEDFMIVPHTGALREYLEYSKEQIQEAREQWVSALRSGKFKEHTGPIMSLLDGRDNVYGVLMRICFYDRYYVAKELLPERLHHMSNDEYMYDRVEGYGTFNGKWSVVHPSDDALAAVGMDTKQMFHFLRHDDIEDNLLYENFVKIIMNLHNPGH